MTSDSRDPQNDFRLAMIASAWNVVGGMIGASFLGYVIGKKCGDFLTGTLIGMFVGLVYCGYEIWRLIRELNKKK